MLDKDTLSRLSQLKSDIQAAKEYGVGHVAGTNGRFGFVRLEDGRDAFLSPEKMQRVIPGDKVKVSLTKNDKDQLEATLESLLEQSLSRFLGQYRVTKKGHFVVPLGNAPGLKSSPINRWIFLPPKSRGRCKDGDMVVARLQQHPYDDGKASARILENIGQESDPHIERLYVSAKYDLQPRYSEQAQKQTKDIVRSFKSEQFGDERTDFTEVPFVTIDAETTRDMDDAVALTIDQDSDQARYKLHVAIADPASFIDQHSPLAQSSHRSAQSLYLLGGTIPMLPEELANQCFSLAAGALRPVLSCRMDINTNGEITHTEFARAKIRSHGKLDYQRVGAFLDGTADSYTDGDSDPQIATMLKQLAELTDLRRRYRETHQIVSSDQAEYAFEVNQQGKICAVHLRERTQAHKIVEEAMLATNYSAGQFLAKAGKGLFTTHTGFREDRLGEVKALLKEEQIENDDIMSLDGFVKLVNKLNNSQEKASLLPALRRMMPTSELSLDAKGHLGIGMSHYATITSPIRRFTDLFNHWAILSELEGTKFRNANEDYLAKLSENLSNGRLADRELQQWLICQYAESLVGATDSAKIRIVTQQGFGARLETLGIDGFILFDKKTEKSFDAKRMTLDVGGQIYKLEDVVQVKVDSVDMDKRRIAFSVA
ncbi:VacB/RNase II family 3'-5' exoribonuclease [Teredinibacter turnerae]|uniref:VacB/RNase II family 3'-5' exoribonuclease n=1 Tax=Teredinibacter turnerae TaxID=2426 RepID=UPI00037911E3|nr:VacB/RNase II family 3'-5' exoribonuclease [Teredinibacter turnerae]